MALAGTAAAAPSSTAKLGCKLSGVHYFGSGAKGTKLCFTLSSDGRKLRELVLDYRASCSSGGEAHATSRTTNPKTGVLTTLSASGAFSFGSAGSYFKGAVRGSSASGKLRQKQSSAGPGGLPETCDSGVVSWTARRG